MTDFFPKIAFKSSTQFDIEVMTLAEIYTKLSRITDHDPFSAHKIQFYFIVVVSKGSYSHYVDFKYYDVKERGVLFIAKNQVHHFTETIRNAEGFCIVLNSYFLEKNYFLSKSISLNRLYNYHLESPEISQENSDDNNFVEIVKALYNEYQSPNDFAKDEMLRSLLHILLLKAERAKESHSINKVKRRWLELFNSFKNALQVGYTESRNSRQYASELLISYKLLNDIVKNLTGKTAKAFIDDFVTIEIKRYLVSTSLSVKEISYKTGFEEPANMIKFFKKNTKSTPLQFRKSLQ